ncbi:unnamed protein product, partial [Ectocarpus fasciculatus]
LLLLLASSTTYAMVFSALATVCFPHRWRFSQALLVLSLSLSLSLSLVLVLVTHLAVLLAALVMDCSRLSLNGD